MNNLIRTIKTRTIGLIAIAVMVTFTAIACGGGGTPPTAVETSAEVGIPPEKVVDYIHTVLLADRTAYTKHVVNRLKKLEGKEKPDGVINAEATETWKDTDGVPLPAQMFRLGSEVALENTTEFTYNLISTWYINDNHNPKSEFEKIAMEEVNKTGEPYKDYQEIAGQTYYSALYPDKAVAEACVSCHNTHPVHLERYPDKKFELGEVRGGIIINLPVDKT